MLSDVIVGFDTETTGTDTSDPNVRIVTYAIVMEHNGEILSSREWMLNPEVDIPSGASDVHGITTDYAAKNGMDYLEGLQQLADIFKFTIDKGYTHTAFNAAFDISLIRNEFIRHGVDFDFNLWDNMFVFDPFVIDKYLDKYRKGSRKLGDVAKHYGFDLSNAHNALADVEATIHVAKVLIPRMTKSLSGVSNKEVFMAAQKDTYAEQRSSLQDYLRRKENDDSIELDTQWPFKLGEVRV